MAERRARHPRREGAFSLLEVIVAIALISIVLGALAPLAVRQVHAAREQATRARMDHVVRALVGDPARDEFGYLGDLGAVPATLADLNDPTGKPAYAIDPSDGTGYGWNGPYAPGASAPGAAPVDAWGIAYQYVPPVAQLRSAGRDRTFGTPDDIVRPPAALPTTGNLVVTVLGIPAAGGPAEQLDASRATVFVASSAGGVRSESAMTGGGPFSAGGLHLGLHGLRAVGSGSYAGAAAVRDVVAVRRGTNRATLVLRQPAGGGGP